MKKRIHLSIALCFCIGVLFSQNLPSEVRLTDDGRLIHGGNPTEGFYDPNVVHKLEITLEETNWFQLLDGTNGPNGTPGQTLTGILTVNDTLVLDSVLVSIKGQTSDRQNNTEKKSFKIEIDELVDQDLFGYDNLNLNCAFQDHSSMREVLYYDISRSFTPALKGSFVDLYINGQSWGPYNNIQQIEGTYIKEWFTNNDGTRWRCVRPDGVGGPGPGGPGGPFGTGLSTLNYNGSDSTDYNENYTLKKTTKENPWEDLIEVCDVLNNKPISDLYDELKDIFDIDRAMWFLAQESIFADDDSYIHKGGMDYYAYWDEATDRLVPMEVDGNSVLALQHITWSPFYHEDDSDFPLLNRLLQNNEVRQRYLAHMRTILDQYFTSQKIDARIDAFASILDQRVQDDPKKIYSYNEYVTGVQRLKDLVADRINYLSSFSEINREGVMISNLRMESTEGIGMAPLPNEEAVVAAEIGEGEQGALLYYGTGLDGVFERVEMFDDGMHGDQLADDNIYGASIPGFTSGTYVRYYIEAKKDDAFSTATYYPSGAEHDVFIYQVETAVSASEDVVINEFMADNAATISDNAGDFDDWIELYNKGTESIDLTGYYLSDDDGNINKWEFPENTVIEPEGYLIVWADEDDDESGELHSNFKLSAGGEVLLFVNPENEVIELIEFDEQEEDKSYARSPNGTGDFQIRNATFNKNNDDVTNVEEVLNDVLNVYPNPSSNYINIVTAGKLGTSFKLTIVNSTGVEVMHTTVNDLQQIDVSNLSNGLYVIVLQDLENTKIMSSRIGIVR